MPSWRPGYEGIKAGTENTVLIEITEEHQMYTHYSTPDSRMEALTELFGEETIDDDIYSEYLTKIANNPHNPWTETFPS